jgi:dTDP-4-amino-4,6-dideoxygalactose transaminase
MAVHMGGLAVDVAALRRALPSNVAIVEDAAHAIGSTYADGFHVGSSGNLTCFSFYANKNLSTGEGGAIALFDADAAERLRSLRQHGLSSDAWKRFTHASAVLTPTINALGYKANYTDLQAAIGRVQLRRQPDFAARRLQVARRYHERLAGWNGLQFQWDLLASGHARHLVVAILPTEKMSLSRNDLLLALRQRNIGASVHYRPLHTMPLYQTVDMAPLPHTDMLANRLLTLPVSASMTVADADDVVDELHDIVGVPQIIGRAS